MNKRIARELNRVAKTLVSSGEIANTEGKYKNFTGIIDWKGSRGQVMNATFELSIHGIVWEDGIWKDGIWHGGTWKDGIWENGTWKDGIWKDGTWKDGIWVNGIWKDSRWYVGKWEGGE